MADDDILNKVDVLLDANARDRKPLTKEEARRRGLLGGRDPKQKPSMKLDRLIWKNTAKYPDIADAIEAMSGEISARTAYRLFGKRGTQIGRKKRK